MKIFCPTQDDFRAESSAPWAQGFIYAIEDYVTRSKEEISLREAQAAIDVALSGSPELLLLIAIDDDDYLLGWCLNRFQPGTEVSGHLVFVWQAWVNPLRARMRELARTVLPIIITWAQAKGASRLVLMTRRYGRGYERLLGRLGFHEHARYYAMEVPAHANV